MKGSWRIKYENTTKLPIGWVIWIRNKYDKANNVLKYGKYFKCLFNSFLSQLFRNSVLFCSLFLNSDYSFSNFSGNFLFADQQGTLPNHRSYCASICMPLIGPHMINFFSVIIYDYSFHLREWAPLELEGSFCHNNSPSNYIIRQLDTGFCSKRTEIALKQYLLDPTKKEITPYVR